LCQVGVFFSFLFSSLVLLVDFCGARLLCCAYDLHAGFWQGQLPSLAAAHPATYARFIESCLRCPLLTAVDMVAASGHLACVVTAVAGSPAALSNTAAVAGLASALTSLVKRAVQFTKAAVLSKGQQLEQDDEISIAAAKFPAALPHIVEDVLQRLAVGLTTAVSSSSSSSDKRQVAASAALLAVVVARSIVQLADAMDAAGPQLLLDSLTAAPAFAMGWASAYGGLICTQMQFVGAEHPTCVQAQQHWQMKVFDTITSLCSSLRAVGLLQQQQPLATAAAAAAGVDAAEHAGTASAGVATSSSSVSAAAGPADSAAAESSSSRSSEPQIKWSYLLRLQQDSKKWRAAAAAWAASSRDMAVPLLCVFAAAMQGSSSSAAERIERSCKDSLQLARTLTAVAPLPVVCNNPSCENLGGVSEAAAASKACAGCKCRYCSAACQKADWLRHKRACRRMAAAGAACS
jgi:hypothetical protein